MRKPAKIWQRVTSGKRSPLRVTHIQNSQRGIQDCFRLAYKSYLSQSDPFKWHFQLLDYTSVFRFDTLPNLTNLYLGDCYRVHCIRVEFKNALWLRCSEYLETQMNSTRLFFHFYIIIIFLRIPEMKEPCDSNSGLILKCLDLPLP